MASFKASNGIVPSILRTETSDSDGKVLAFRTPLDTPIKTLRGEYFGPDTLKPNGIKEQDIQLHTSTHIQDTISDRAVMLELQDGTTCEGFSFGAHKSIAGELVFQTGMVGYPESVTDPSYRGQILVITFPLVGNYGVPSRETPDKLLDELPAHFESSEIHIAGLIVSAYSGETFSHYLAHSSLGTWLKEQNVPAMYGVDTRALTKRIRQQGSMLGRMLFRKESSNGLLLNEHANHKTEPKHPWQTSYETVDWVDPNKSNLVAAGKTLSRFLYV